MIRAVLFDLDGTLLPMDQKPFVQAYYGGLAKKAAPYGYAPSALIDAVGRGSYAMFQNDGRATNEAVFWDTFASILGKTALQDVSIFDAFYENEFQSLSALCGKSDASAKTIALLHERGIRCILATNPVFPRIATASRILWAGLKWEDFEMVTTYENSCFCKPNPDYYRSILDRLGLRADECIMVGNDVAEDMVAATLGMKVCLVTDCLINTKALPTDAYPKTTLSDLPTFLLRMIEEG